jgi:hypothetical protein
MLEPRTALAKDIIARLESDERLRDHIFATKIRRNIRMAQSADAGCPVIHLDTHCHGAWAYRRLARELLVRLGDARTEDFPELRNPMEEDTRIDELPALAGPDASAGSNGWPRAETGSNTPVIGSLPAIIPPDGTWPIRRDPVAVTAQQEPPVEELPDPDEDSWDKW